MNFGGQGISTTSGTGFNKTGVGTMIITSGATYNGGFTLSAGTMVAGGVNALGSGGVLNLNGGILTVNSGTSRDFSAKFSTISIGGNTQFGDSVGVSAGTGNMTFSDAMALGTVNRTLTLGYGGTVVFGGVIGNSGSGGVTFGGTAGGTGRFDVTNASNSFTGDVTITGGEVRFTADGSLGAASNDIIIDGGRFATGNSATYALGAGRQIFVGDGVGTSISTPGAGTLTYNGVIADKAGETGAWAKQGGGTMALAGISTYSGGTAINNGTVQLTTGNNRLPTDTTVSLGQAASTNLGTLDLNARSQQIAGLNSTSGTNSGASKNTVTSTSAATLTLGGSGTYSYGDATAANSGIIAGAIILTKSGTGTQTLGDVNTYTGGTNINGGTLAIANAAALGSSGTISFGGGTLQYSGITTDLSNRFSTAASQQYKTDTNSQNVTWGTASTSSGGSLTKLGTGALTLGTANTYTGTTTISGGSLTLGSSGSINNSATIDVQSGATFNVGSVSGGYSLASGQTLKGTGTVSGAMTIASGATLSPGNSPGTLLQTGNQTWNGGGNYNWQIASATGTEGTDSDLVDITGSLTIAANSGNKFNLNLLVALECRPRRKRRHHQLQQRQQLRLEDRRRELGDLRFRGGCLQPQHRRRQRHLWIQQRPQRRNLHRLPIRERSEPRLHRRSRRDQSSGMDLETGSAPLQAQVATEHGRTTPAAGIRARLRTSHGAYGPVTVTTATANKGINFLADGYAFERRHDHPFRHSRRQHPPPSAAEWPRSHSCFFHRRWNH